MKEIRIDDRDSWSHQIKPDSNIAVNFLHEILHACDYMCGESLFGIKENSDETEKRIDALAENLFQVLHDNKLMF